MIYELVNPSDKYTLESATLEPAAIACLFLGEGMYALTDEAGQQAVPIFIGGGAEEWYAEKFGRALNDGIKANMLDVAECLESLVIGNRQDYDAAMKFIAEDKLAAFKADWHDRHRSSMNDIGRRAARYAKAFREKASDKAASGHGVS